MTKKKVTEKEIDKAIKKAEKDIPHKVIKSEKKDTTQVCPICKGKDLKVISKDDLFVYFQCNHCKTEFTGISTDHFLI